MCHSRSCGKSSQCKCTVMSAAVGSQTHGAGHTQQGTIPSPGFATTRGHHGRHTNVFQGVGPHVWIICDWWNAPQNEVRLLRTQTRCANSKSARIVGMTSPGDIDMGHHIGSMLCSAVTWKCPQLTGNVLQFDDRFISHIPLQIVPTATMPLRGRFVWLCDPPCWTVWFSRITL